MSRHQPADHLAWRTAEVHGRRVRYGVAGHGLPVLFLHGWALSNHAYRRALKRLVRMGCQVYAPSLPGFGGSSGLGGAPDLVDYAEWAAGFLAAVGEDEAVLAVGHSFGGAVAAQLAHDFPERVAHLVLINSVGGGIWPTAAQARTLAERPLWQWALFFPVDIALAPRALPTVSTIVEDVVPNVLHNPLGVWRAGMLARRADLSVEMGDIRGYGIPVTVLWGEGDLIVPRDVFEATCRALGVSGHVVPGRHSWLLADPDGFASAMLQPVAAASAARLAQAALSARPA